MWGASTSAYQIEGSWNSEGKGESIWDTFTHIPGKIKNNETGDVAADHYKRFKEDISYLKKLGVDSSRFSISWSRIFPKGRGETNQQGIDHYKHVLIELQQAKIRPVVTLYHWDLPQALQDEGGWLNETIIQDFVNYAEVCFTNFGDYVSDWITMHDPFSFTWFGYGTGTHAPGRCSDRNRCSSGDSQTEPYIAAHNAILAHASVYKKFSLQNNTIGISLSADWPEPYFDNDRGTSDRYLEFNLGWFADPIFKGTDYPSSMRAAISDRLPQFTADQLKLLENGTSDFFGITHFTSFYILNGSASDAYGWVKDVNTSSSITDKDGKFIGPISDSDWRRIVPWGIRKLLIWIHQQYNREIWTTGNGVDVYQESCFLGNL
eukprot:TRINITY_DN6580_c0_g2_i3.p1 TRINITY_DN6580_c0_g2~~TRINITY_DN6580_c0_g2_i3.p1  ORF type:complete len:386 (-),score=61.59 TRINITY_DN6580_c0_g2_i3:369-1499(-)